jgi:hypothetical protein
VDQGQATSRTGRHTGHCRQLELLDTPRHGRRLRGCEKLRPFMTEANQQRTAKPTFASGTNGSRGLIGGRRGCHRLHPATFSQSGYGNDRVGLVA